MNEFTKEELEFIQDGACHWRNKDISTPWILEFKNKIQSMIDNYCNHEVEGYTVRTIKCKKCGMRINHE